MAETLSITEQEQEVIQGEFDKLLTMMTPSLINDDKANLKKAFELANHAHRHQRRKSGEPYILHPIRVMIKVSTSDERIAAILHDTVEDTNVTFDDLVDHGFSDAIISAVKALTVDLHPILTRDLH